MVSKDASIMAPSKVSTQHAMCLKMETVIQTDCLVVVTIRMVDFEEKRDLRGPAHKR